MTNNILDIIIKNHSDFDNCAKNLHDYITSSKDFKNLLLDISIIPECISHDSSEEKLWAKASDIALSHAFKLLGLKSSVLNTRSDSADVIAASVYHNYNLVADAKSFRLSRTAKNQKDFKIVSLSHWRKDAEYAVLCAPYFQYPFKQSQIYSQAIEHNVNILSWEHLIFLIENNIIENSAINLSPLWNFSYNYGKDIIFSDIKNCFINFFDKILCETFAIDYDKFIIFLKKQKRLLKQRGEYEAHFWQNEIDKILKYSRRKAINELIKSKKINEKIIQINNFIKRLNSGIQTDTR